MTPIMPRALLLLTLLSALPAEAGQSYTLPQLEQLALRSHPSLAAAQAEVDAARARRLTAAAWPNPDIDYLAGKARPLSQSAASGQARSYGISQPLDLPWRRAPRQDAAEAGLRAAQAGLRVTTGELLSRLRLRYFEVIRRQADVDTAREDLALMEKVRTRIEARVGSGESGRYELIKADAEMLNSRKTLRVAESRLQQARAFLRQGIGPQLEEDYMLDASQDWRPDEASLEALQRQVRQDNPELNQARAELDRASQQLRLEKATRWPAISLKASRDEDPDLASTRIGLGITLPIWDQRRGPVAEALADQQRQQFRVQAREFGLGRELDIAVQQLEIARSQVNALESGILRQAESALRVADAAYRFGERGFLDVLDAQRVYRAARNDLNAARFELASAWIDIERLRGATGDLQP